MFSPKQFRELILGVSHDDRRARAAVSCRGGATIWWPRGTETDRVPIMSVSVNALCVWQQQLQTWDRRRGGRSDFAREETIWHERDAGVEYRRCSNVQTTFAR